MSDFVHYGLSLDLVDVHILVKFPEAGWMPRDFRDFTRSTDKQAILEKKSQNGFKFFETDRSTKFGAFLSKTNTSMYFVYIGIMRK